MELYIPYLAYILVAVIVSLLLKFVWHFGFKKILAFIFNVIAGGIVLYLINFIPGINIPLNILTSIVVAITGLPGVIFLLIYYLIIK